MIEPCNSQSSNVLVRLFADFYLQPEIFVSVENRCPPAHSFVNPLLLKDNQFHEVFENSVPQTAEACPSIIFTLNTGSKTECGEILALDSTFCKVHRHALGARKNAPGHERMQDIDSSRGGKTSKIHILIDEKFRVVKFLLSAGNVNDNLVALSLLHDVDLKSKAVLADKAYSTAKIRDYLEKQEAFVCIPDKVNAKVKHDLDRELYKKRNVVERFFCRLKDYLRITIRLDKLSSSFSSFVCLAIFLLSQRIHQ